MREGKEILIMIFTGAFAACAHQPPVPAKPAEPAVFDFGRGTAKITLTWEPNQEKDMDHYNVYYFAAPEVYGTPLRVDKSAAGAIVKGLQKGRRYYFKVTAVNQKGAESGASEEVNKLAD